MAVNNNFYKVANELMARASKGAGLTPVNVIDYASFIEAGTQLKDNKTWQELTNDFASEIANKVELTIDIARQYNADLESMNMGSISPEAAVEIINNGFFDVRAAEFVSLTDGETVDQYVINKGKQEVDYYYKSNAGQIPVTIQTTELKGAFRSPEAMDAFLYAKVMYALNSKNQTVEVARYALLANAVVDLTETSSAYVATAATSPLDCAQRYKLVSLYNTLNSTSLTAETAIYDKEFIRFAVSTINAIKKKMVKASESFNAKSWKTFTPASELRTYVVAPFGSAIDAYLYPDTFHNETNRLENFETIPYLQNEKKPFIANYSYGSKQDNSLETPPVLAICADRYALMEFTEIDDVTTTDYNAAGRYTNDWVNFQYAYMYNRYANLVLFTLD